MGFRAGHLKGLGRLSGGEIGGGHLGIRHVIQGAEDKSRALDVLLAKLKLDVSQVACIGDDTPDITLFGRVALGIAVADAHPLALSAAHAVTTLSGGRGAVREACDWLLDARSRA